MIYFARTVLNILLPPSGLLIMLIVGALLLKTRFKKSGKTFVVISVALLYFFSTGLGSGFLLEPLENDYPPFQQNHNPVDAIVVLTSGAKDLSGIGLGIVPDPISLQHLTHGIKLFNEMDSVPLIISGGRASPEKPYLSFGKALGNEALQLGISEDNLIIEDDSKNTYEGALKVFELLKGKKKIILVTSAYHMGRSVMLFKKAGFDVIPAPTNHYLGMNVEKLENILYSFIPNAFSLYLSSIALYEYSCKSWYMLMDFISNLIKTSGLNHFK